MTRFAETPRSAPGKAAALALASLALAGCSLFGGGTKAPSAAPPVVPAAPAAAPPARPLIDKGDPDQRFNEALKLMKDKQAKEAYDAFLSLAKDFPQFSGPLADLAILQANAKQRAPALINFQKALKDNPQNYVAQNWLGTLQREAGDYAAAEAAYRGALAAKPDYAAAHLNLGLLYDVYLKRPQAALVEYREYQRLAGSGKLIVSAWIRDLEDRIPPAPAAAPPAAPATPVAKPEERKS
ncbi:MAG: hypothetical protein NVS9B10_04870 [Nevskia sp.]